MTRPPVLDIGYLLISANRLLGTRAAARIRELGLTPQQAMALMAIDSHEGRVSTPGEIGAFLAADSPTVSGIVARLERNDYVRTATNPADRRSRLVSLTERAELLLPSIHETVNQSSEWAESVMDADELGELTSLLGRFVALLEKSAASA